MAYGKVILRDDAGVVITKNAKTLGKAQELAQSWCIYGKGKSIRNADIIRHRDDRRVMHYWFDGQLQYMRY